MAHTNVLLFKKIFNQYVDFNLSSNYVLFFGFTDYGHPGNFSGIGTSTPLELCNTLNKFPLLPCQFHVLYCLNPSKYDGYLDGDFMELIGNNLKNNTVILLNKNGDLVGINLYSVGMEHRKLVLDFFAKKTETLYRFRYLRNEKVEMMFAPSLADMNLDYNDIKNSKLEFGDSKKLLI